VDTVEGLRDAARRARECAVIGQAVTLARWIENGNRPVTVGRVLRKADVPAAGAALGVDVPSRLRTMADIRALHRPWCAAIATGLLQVSDGSVTAGPALECWPPDDAGLLAGWLAGLRAVCAAESYPQDEDSVRLVALALLTVLGVVIQVLFGWDGDHLHVFQKGRKRYGDPFVNLEGTGDEEAVRVRDAMVPGGTIAYTYDLGACWEHEITLEATVPHDRSQDYPVCVEFRGDSPVEYWYEDEPEEPEPFGLNEVNRRLAALNREPA
jgi:hypothetical protein